MLQDLIERVTFGVELEVTNGRECGYCDGEGYVHCPECYGEGEVYCEECEGHGYYTCPECDGYGDNCPHCEGRGEVECAECNGSGYVTCTRCDGDGTIACPDCDGTGRTYLPPAPRGWDSKDEHCGYEFNSPAYYLEHYPTFLNEIFALMDECEFDSYDYDPTGMHVHVGVENLGVDVKRLLERLVDVWLAIEERMCDYVACTTEVREDKYANRWIDCYSDPEEEVKRQVKDDLLYGFDRYKTLNYAAYPKHGTVEFRLWNSPENRQYVKTAVTYSVGIVIFAAMRSFDNLPVTERQVFNFLDRWCSYMNNTIDRNELPMAA